MYFRIAKNELLNKLNIVSRAVSINSPLPSLHGIKLSVDENSVELTASNMDISIKALITPNEENKLEIATAGSVILEARYIVDMIRKIDADMVEMEIIDGSLTKIRGNSVNFDLNGSKASNYPLIDFEKKGDCLELKGDLLKDIIFQTCFATSDKENRPALTGLNLKCEGNKLTCVATDSYRLAQKIIYLEDDHNFRITVPAKSLNEIAKILTGENEVKLYVSNNKLLVEIDDILIQTRLIEGDYPETGRLIPTSHSHELVIDARNMLTAIDRASFIKNDGVSIIKMEMSSDEIVISSKANEVGSVERITPISYNGDNLSISFKGQHVYEAVRALNTDKITIQFGGNMKVFVLKAADSDDVIQLVTPIRTYA